MANKLELTWVGKENRIEIEPRILIESTQLGYSYSQAKKGGQLSLDEMIGVDGIYDNMLIHGDNLLALKALEQKFSGQVKCIYIDPPYNTGSAFEHYDDNVEHSTWLSLMKPRLELLKSLLSVDGSIFIQIDDNEVAYLKVLCDEVFGRSNFINMISVNMKNIAGASGGGEDKRLKKNCEYILAYAKDYSLLPLFNGSYTYTEISELMQQYINEGRSWKYTSVLVDAGEKEYIGSTVDGAGNEIKAYTRKNLVTMSINQLAKRDGITSKEAYRKFGINVYRTTNAQSSIRTRVMEYRKENNINDSILSIEYTPRTGKNKGVVYEQFYKDDICNLFVWLRDTSEIVEGELYKKDLQGTYWDMNAWMKNLTKEGDVTFANGKKPEQLIRQILHMSTNPGDLVLDSFLGSGTTAAVAHKMGRRWIGIEMGDHAYTHCKVRLDKVVSGEDQGGITKTVNWKGGGGYKFYELAPTLITMDKYGREIINPEYNADMLAAAMAKQEGFNYSPSATNYWKQGQSTENSYIYTTTQHLTREYLDEIASDMADGEYLIIACKSFGVELSHAYKNMTIKKIPKILLGRCEYGKTDYKLNIIDMPATDDMEEDDEQ